VSDVVHAGHPGVNAVNVPPKNADRALNALAEVLKPSVEEREIIETPTKKTRKKATKKADLPF